METNSSLVEVVSLSQCHHPYNNARQSTIGRTKNQFFQGTLPGSGGLGRAVIRLHQTTNHTNQGQFHLQIQGKEQTLLSTTKEILDQLLQSREPLLSLGLDIMLIELCTCMHTSWWQTVLICLQLALLIKRPLGTRDSSRVPLTLESIQRCFQLTQQGELALHGRQQKVFQLMTY